jgi:hypothetical protein
MREATVTLRIVYIELDGERIPLVTLIYRPEEGVEIVYYDDDIFFEKSLECAPEWVN